MSTVLVIGIIVLLIICISLVVILLNLNSKNTIPKSKTSVSTNSQNKNRLLIENIQIPKKIEQMDRSSLSAASKKVFESFKSLDYVNKPAGKLDKIEWHTWQVSLLMAMIKENKGSFVPDNKSLFHDVIVNLNNNSLPQVTQRVVDKFNNNIDIYKSRDELSQDIFWSSREVSILFYYMSRH